MKLKLLHRLMGYNISVLGIMVIGKSGAVCLNNQWLGQGFFVEGLVEWDFVSRTKVSSTTSRKMD